MQGLTGLIDAGQSSTIEALQVLEWATELAVDVIDDPGPSRACILVGWDDLVDHAGQGPGFIEGQEPPWRPVCVAGNARSGGRRGGQSGLEKGATVEPDTRLHTKPARLDCKGAAGEGL